MPFSLAYFLFVRVDRHSCHLIAEEIELVSDVSGAHRSPTSSAAGLLALRALLLRLRSRHIHLLLILAALRCASGLGVLSRAGGARLSAAAGRSLLRRLCTRDTQGEKRAQH